MIRLLFLPLLLLSTVLSQQEESPPGFENWKCTSSPTLLGGAESTYRALVSSTCVDLKDGLSQCCVNFNECEIFGFDCVEKHKKCNAPLISGSKRECSAIADKLIREERPLPDKSWECNILGSRVGEWAAKYHHLMDSTCVDLKHSFNQCCISFKHCNMTNEFSCLEEHEKCNDKAVSGREKECSDIANGFIGPNTRLFPGKDWKCYADPDKPGALQANYRNLMKSNCESFRDKLNQLCISFNACKGFNCVNEHEACNAKAIPRTYDCSSITKTFIDYGRDLYPEDNWKCLPQKGQLVQWTLDYHMISQSLHCAVLKDGLNQCCENFNNCYSKNGTIVVDNCVEEHSQCNAKVLSGLERHCSRLADKLIRNDLRSAPDEDWKCKVGPKPGVWEHNYRVLVTSSCANLKDDLNQCCITFNDCFSKREINCVREHEECNSKVIRGREEGCSAIADSFREKNVRLIHNKNWKCLPQPGKGKELWDDYRALLDSWECIHFADGLSQCCAKFNDCKGVNCVEDHEKCNAKVVSGKEKECSAIAGKFIRNDLRQVPDENWKCLPPRDRFGGWEEDYRALMEHQLCADLKYGLNECCVHFNDCNSKNIFNCVEEHEKCNANVISGQKEECSAIADRLIRRDLRGLPDEGWKCRPSPLNYLNLVRGPCSDLKTSLNQCCTFSKGLKINHKKCNDKWLIGREQTCSDIANSFILQDQHPVPDKNWKCQRPRHNSGAWEQDYRTLIESHYCADLKDGLSQCCVNFNECKGDHCVEGHEECSAKAISLREKECSDIADKFIRKDLRRLPDKDWKCLPPYGVFDKEQDYRNLIQSEYCAPLKDRINQCCLNFNDCHSKKKYDCVEEHEKCNDEVISGRECRTIVYRFIRQDLRRVPETEWKCHASEMPGVGEQNSDDPCSDLKEGFNQCCVHFNSCSSNKGIACVYKHQSCNSRVIYGREKECSAIANKFIQEDKPRQADNETVLHTWGIITLSVLACILFICVIVFIICWTVRSKRREQNGPHNSLSRVSSVKSSDPQ